MANYYNLTGWKHTGFDWNNRPFSRDVLSTDYFTNSTNYFQMKGVVVKRDDMSGLSYVDLPGSVKDIKGDQVNAPNSVGTHGPGGPFYSWEEVDYIRLVRTGYPGDEDFIDISGNQLDPWNAPKGEGKLYIAYYFVVGMDPLARNVTRLYLTMDDWTTQGASDELIIETGYKIRGPITDAEDAAGYNLAGEGIGIIEPLEVKAHGMLNISESGEGTVANNEFIVSSIDLLTNSPEGSMSGLTVTTTDGDRFVIPQIVPAQHDSIMYLNEPGATSPKSYLLIGQNFFNPKNAKVMYNLSCLQSAGQLELQDSYIIPKKYLKNAVDNNGVYSGLSNAVHSIKPPVARDIGSYPRKADYLFGQEVLYSEASGDTNIQPFSEVADDTINVWAVVGPSGCPYARFANIRSHAYLYDQSVQGMTWLKKAVTLQGASGTMWAQIQNAFAKGSLARAESANEIANFLENRDWKQNKDPFSFWGTNRALDNAVGTSGSSFIEGILNAPAEITSPFPVLNRTDDKNIIAMRQELRAKELKNAGVQAEIDLARAKTAPPYVSFVPDPSMGMFTGNGFGVYIVNTTAKDRERLKNFFRRYGYSGLYTPLTWQNINIKRRVNFIQAEGVCLKHARYPMRDTMRVSKLLEQGLFLWNEQPNQTAFADNADN